MTLDEAIKHANAAAKEQDKLRKRYDDASGYTRSHNKDIRTNDAKRCEKCAEENRKIAEWLKELKRLREQTRWIPVSERLPENPGRYLAYIVNKHDNKLQYIMTCDYQVNGFSNWFPDDDCASDNVIAWMPLPKPYKAESEDK